MKIEIDGRSYDKEHVETCLEWIQEDGGNIFWAWIKDTRDEAHDRASLPPGSTYKTGMGGERMIPLEILNAKARDNLSKENTLDVVMDFKEFLRDRLGLTK